MKIVMKHEMMIATMGAEELQGGVRRPEHQSDPAGRQ
jgi:hypothetical protein